VVELRDGTNAYAPLGWVIDAKAIVNGLVGLMATGGSTNHALHLVAIARTAGVLIDWTDFDDISRATPLLARVYPNGSGDVNQFQAAGGLAFLTRELLDAGLLHEDVLTAAGKGLRGYTAEPFLEDGKLVWKPAPAESLDPAMLRPVSDPFDREGGLRLLTGNLGRAVIKTSAVKAEHRAVEAPAIVFEGQEAFLAAFKAGQLDRDFVAVVRFQGPRANGMPELHSLTPSLSVLQDRGRHVALVTDGRMSGASGKVPAAIHLTPEAADGGPIARLKSGDVIRLDAERGTLEVLVEAAELAARPAAPDPRAGETGYGRELFAPMRALAQPAELGGGVFFRA
jgi:phosphogluconate dehydratase